MVTSLDLVNLGVVVISVKGKELGVWCKCKKPYLQMERMPGRDMWVCPECAHNVTKEVLYNNGVV